MGTVFFRVCYGLWLATPVDHLWRTRPFWAAEGSSFMSERGAAVFARRQGLKAVVKPAGRSAGDSKSNALGGAESLALSCESPGESLAQPPSPC